MHDDLPQQIATFALVLGAGIYVARRAWHVFHPASAGSSGGGCGGGCSSCPSSSASEPSPQIVAIGMPSPSGRYGKSV